MSDQVNQLEALLPSLLERGVDKDVIFETFSNMEIELVLTAHPTELARRTMLQKHNRIAEALDERDRSDLTRHERKDVERTLRREIEAAWGTDDVRHERPTPPFGSHLKFP